jgi:hypothetical protein
MRPIYKDTDLGFWLNFYHGELDDDEKSEKDLNRERQKEELNNNESKE